jgi:hypothetical protein
VFVFLRVVPEGLAATSAAVGSLAVRLAAAEINVASLTSRLVPPATDSVSPYTAAGSSAHCDVRPVVAAHGVEELRRSSVGPDESGASYVTGDAAVAASYPVTGGRR